MNRASAQAQGGGACMYACINVCMSYAIRMHVCMYVCMLNRWLLPSHLQVITIKYLYFYIKVKAWASEAWVAANPFTCYYNEILICLKSG